MDIKILKFSGQEVEDHLQDLAHLRIAVFREWPYLYEGSLDYEKKYLQVYTQSKRSIVCLLKDGSKTVGATTGLPLSDEAEEFIKPFRDNSYDIDKIFYFGESIILPKYRGHGLGKDFFELREKHAQQALGDNLEYTCFGSIQRPLQHPLCNPQYYQLVYGLWKQHGYVPHPELVAHIPWQDIGEKVETEKPLIFWLKKWT